jgi:DNA-binding YbaB/EbfC family protein
LALSTQVNSGVRRGADGNEGAEVILMNPLQMMRQAQQLQERLQKEMSTLTVEGAAGGGMVTVVVNGHKHIQKLTIDPEVVSKDDVQMLQDLVAAAVNDALRKVDEELKSKVGGIVGGLGLPGLG